MKKKKAAARPIEIQERGLTLTLDGRLNIDTALWTTQAKLCKKLGVSPNALNNRVRRYTANGALPYYYIPQLGLRLVPNVMEINELSNFSRGSKKKQ